MSADYADSAQARECDLLYQRYKDAPKDKADLETFFAGCNERRAAESIASKARLRKALGELEVFFKHPE